jgi:hypothetical protein
VRWSKNVSPTGRIVDAAKNYAAGAVQIDSTRSAAYTHGSILQAREAGKAVQIGRGPATVIG